MRNKTIPNSKGLASWLDDFIVGLGKKEVTASEEIQNIEDNTEETLANEQEEIETVATVNINDLDKVVWNDETFRVHFEENGANVINEFGNGVTFLKGLKTIEEVDYALNGNQVVVASEMEEEIDSIEASEVAEDDFENALTAAIDAIPDEDEEEVVANSREELEDVVVQNDSPEEDVIAAIIAGFDELEKRLADVEQLYARNPQFENDELATRVQEEELKHVTETADETQNKINEEQSHDLTTPAGRIETSVQTEQPSEVQEIVTNDTEEHTSPEEGVKEEEVSEETDNEFEKLTGKDEKIFQNGICPETGEELVKSKTAGAFLGIYSPKGGTEYAVNLETGDIFKYKG